MKYELYEEINYNKNKAIFYKFETDNLLPISAYIENYPLSNNSKYIILNNSPSIPLNYSLLGFTEMPSETEHYNIIFDCKSAKEYYHYIKNDTVDSYHLNH